MFTSVKNILPHLKSVFSTSLDCNPSATTTCIISFSQAAVWAWKIRKTNL